MKKWIYRLIVVATIIVVAIIYIDSKFTKARTSDLVADFEIWSHRGVHLEIQENTPEAVNLANDQGFKGVEIDVFFDEEKSFVVSHDWPYKLYEGKELSLNEMLSYVPKNMKIWVDLKNINNQNWKLIDRRLEDVIQKAGFSKNQIYIESDKGNALGSLSKKGWQCIYWVQYTRTQPKKMVKLLWLKNIIGGADFVGISTDHRYIDTSFKRHFRGFNWFVFTINDPVVIKSLGEIHETSVILTDLEGDYAFTSY